MEKSSYLDELISCLFLLFCPGVFCLEVPQFRARDSLPSPRNPQARRTCSHELATRPFRLSILSYRFHLSSTCTIASTKIAFIPILFGLFSIFFSRSFHVISILSSFLSFFLVFPYNIFEFFVYISQENSFLSPGVFPRSIHFCISFPLVQRP